MEEWRDASPNCISHDVGYVFVCVLSSGYLVCRPSDLCVCRVGTPPARR